MARTKGLGKTAALAGLAGLAGLGALGQRNKVNVTGGNEPVDGVGKPDIPLPPEAKNPPPRTKEELAQLAQDIALYKAGKPIISEERIIEAYKGIPGVRSGTGLPIKAGDEILRSIGEGRFKKGGAVKGWGKARGARKAKVY